MDVGPYVAILFALAAFGSNSGGRLDLPFLYLAGDFGRPFHLDPFAFLFDPFCEMAGSAAASSAMGAQASALSTITAAGKDKF